MRARDPGEFTGPRAFSFMEPFNDQNGNGFYDLGGPSFSDDEVYKVNAIEHYRHGQFQLTGDDEHPLAPDPVTHAADDDGPDGPRQEARAERRERREQGRRRIAARIEGAGDVDGEVGEREEVVELEAVADEHGQDMAEWNAP